MVNDFGYSSFVYVWSIIVELEEFVIYVNATVVMRMGAIV